MIIPHLESSTVEHCDTPQGALSGTRADFGDSRTLGVDTGGDIMPGHDMGVDIGDIMTPGVVVCGDIVVCPDMCDAVTRGLDVGSELLSGRRFPTSSPRQPDQPRLELKI